MASCDLKLSTDTFGLISKKLLECVTDGKVWRITIREWREKRSISQNSLSHMWYKEMSDVFIKKNPKYTPEKVKDMMKNTFLGWEEKEYINAITKEITIKSELRHTSDLDVGEMKFYLDQVYDWALDLGISLTIPENSEYMELQRKQNK
ncbi:hypothetical protein [Phocoenobacter skyensis]|uniref:NinB protein n=1 Tax=Phocoenobacter skyensis TaxID=97481 RepID=A0A1H7XKE2_9PAST|nr:hypothetical protein [Pasteurella skyensis]MDP8184381.1 hypothetical protein [Pasteurella skyensis]QLB22616.1 hypothetical protein A6B44_05105 [Pasteurella skyensis]SEM34123.1 hypothetical protein SAMN05444853_11313 [Pasteurella skyensis]